MEKVHIKTCFSIFVPLENKSLSTAHPTPVSEPTFGLSLFDDQNRPIFLTIRLFYKQRLTSKEDEQQDCLCWAARTPIRQQGDEQQRQSGLLLQLKVKQGIFDFRKVEKRFIRLQVDCTNSEGQIINSAVSKFVQLLPRKRTVDKIGGTNTEGMNSILEINLLNSKIKILARSNVPLVVIPVQWHNINTSYSVDNSAIERANNNYGSDELVSEAIQLLHRAREESEERHHDQLESSVSISGYNMEYALPRYVSLALFLLADKYLVLKRANMTTSFYKQTLFCTERLLIVIRNTWCCTTAMQKSLVTSGHSTSTRHLISILKRTLGC